MAPSRTARLRGAWHRRAQAWLVACALLLPFGWILPLRRLAWVQAAARRAPRKATLE